MLCFQSWNIQLRHYVSPQQCTSMSLKWCKYHTKLMWVVTPTRWQKDWDTIILYSRAFIRSRRDDVVFCTVALAIQIVRYWTVPALFHCGYGMRCILHKPSPYSEDTEGPLWDYRLHPIIYHYFMFQECTTRSSTSKFGDATWNVCSWRPKRKWLLTTKYFLWLYSANPFKNHNVIITNQINPGTITGPYIGSIFMQPYPIII